MDGTCKARVACFAGNVFFPGDLSFGFGRVHVFSAKNAYLATRCLQVALRTGDLANPSETVLKVRATK